MTQTEIPKHKDAWEKVMLESIKQSYDNIKLSDVMVHTHGQVIGVNSIVLASQSTILRDIVQARERASTLEDILEPYSIHSVEVFLRALYTGIVPEDCVKCIDVCKCYHGNNTFQMYMTMLEVYQIARILQVHWLIDCVRTWLMENIACDTIFDTLATSLGYDDIILVQACNGLLSRNRLDHVIAYDDWCCKSCDLVVHTLSLPSLLFDTEVDILIMAVRWIEQNINISNRHQSIEVIKCVQVSGLPDQFRNDFVYSYISLISQKLFLALKYPQMNRWKTGSPIQRNNLAIASNPFTEFSIYIDRNTILGEYKEKQRESYYHAGCHVTLDTLPDFNYPVEITVETDKRYKVCYLWIKSLQEPGLFPLGPKSITKSIAEETSKGVIVRWKPFDFVDLQRLFANGRVQFGFVLYKK